MIEQLAGFPDNVAAFSCHGHVTAAEYEKVLIPDVEDRLKRHKKIRIYYEVADDFTGFEAGAMWDDTKLGFSHLLSWERFAVVTDEAWMKHTVKFFGFMMPGEMRTFAAAEAGKAREWIAE